MQLKPTGQCKVGKTEKEGDTLVEGKIVWKKNCYAIQYFSEGQEHLQPLAYGDKLEILVNDTWKKVIVENKNNEQILAGVGYGDGVGCQARMEK